MKTTVKKFKSLIELTNLQGKDPAGKSTTLCDAFNIDIDPVTKLAKVSVMDKTNKMYINVQLVVDTTDTTVAVKIPVVVDEYIGKTSKLARFSDADVISVNLDGNTAKVSRDKPKKTFTINNSVTVIPGFDETQYKFVVSPTGLKLNDNEFNVVIKTTAEAMLDVIEDAAPYYEKIQDLKFPLTITNDSVRLEIGDKTIGSVESDLQVTSILTPVQKKYTFGPGFHNIFNSVKGPVTLYFGEIKGTTKQIPAMIVMWSSGVFEAKYILRGY
jgi:hypothetical protein